MIMASNRSYGILSDSMMDTVALAQAVEERFELLLASWLQKRGMPLLPPASLDRALLGWRMMRVRHKGGDLRNTLDEVKCTREVAQWTVEMNCILRNQPVKRIDWGDDL